MLVNLIPLRYNPIHQPIKVTVESHVLRPPENTTFPCPYSAPSTSSRHTALTCILMLGSAMCGTPADGDAGLSPLRSESGIVDI